MIMCSLWVAGLCCRRAPHNRGHYTQQAFVAFTIGVAVLNAHCKPQARSTVVVYMVGAAVCT